MVSDKTNTQDKMDMDQFMNDFLEGKFLDEEPERRGSSRSSVRKSTNNLRRSKSDEDLPPPVMHRRSTGEPKRRVPRRSKSNEDLPPSLLRSSTGERRVPRRSKSNDLRASTDSRRSSKSPKPQGSRRSQRSSDKEQMDPQMVLRMLEMYADIDDQEKAESYLHYGSKPNSPRNSAKSTPRSSVTGASAIDSPPKEILMRKNVTQAA